MCVSDINYELIINIRMTLKNLYSLYTDLNNKELLY